MDEPGQLLVGQEQQDVVDRLSRRLAGVIALGQLLDAGAHVADERGAVGLAFGVVTGVEVAQVSGHRELDVHVELVALGEREREIGSAGRPLDLGLLDVVDVFDETGQAEYVFGHPLAPLAAGGRARHRLTQGAGRLRQRLGDLGVAAQ